MREREHRRDRPVCPHDLRELAWHPPNLTNEKHLRLEVIAGRASSPDPDWQRPQIEAHHEP